MTTSTDIVNQALEFIDSQARITSLTDGSVEADAAQVIYAPTVNLVLRQADPEFAKRTSILTAVSDAVPSPWPFGYVYPSDCVRFRQLMPSAAQIAADPNDPLPVNWTVAADNVTIANKVIYGTVGNAQGVYTSNAVTESQWDAAFTRSVVLLLASPLSMAIAGRPDFAKALLEQAAAAEQLSESRLG